jgi:hypothetical protein
MREGLGSVFLYNLIIIYILIVFAFLAATMSYSKAFRVNSKMTKIIEKYEGYNVLSDAEIEQMLGTLGYRNKAANCSTYRNLEPVKKISNDYQYCIYEERDADDSRHTTYGILTYINFEMPFGLAFQVPIYSKTERIFCFKTADETCVH